VAVDERWGSLEEGVLAGIHKAQSIEWCSPLKADDYAEYRDGAFLQRVGMSRLQSALEDFWPTRGPQWDALGVTDRGDVLLVEAKAHVGEMCSPGTAAGAASRRRIEAQLAGTAEWLGARPERAPWTGFFYQLGNRLAHLHFLREQGVPAYLVLVNFLNDPDMKDAPTSAEVWRAAYQVAFHVMGLGSRHKLSPYIIEVFPDVAAAGGR
jgi:hypothetical protein